MTIQEIEQNDVVIKQAGPIDGRKSTFVESSFRSGSFRIKPSGTGYSVVQILGDPIDLSDKQMFVLGKEVQIT